MAEYVRLDCSRRRVEGGWKEGEGDDSSIAAAGCILFVSLLSRTGRLYVVVRGYIAVAIAVAIAIAIAIAVVSSMPSVLG